MKLLEDTACDYYSCGERDTRDGCFIDFGEGRYQLCDKYKAWKEGREPRSSSLGLRHAPE